MFITVKVPGDITRVVNLSLLTYAELPGDGTSGNDKNVIKLYFAGSDQPLSIIRASPGYDELAASIRKLADSHCLQQAPNDNAKKVVEACEDKWPANKDDCNKFLKAVATEVGITDISSDYTANKIIEYLEGSPTGWTKLSRGDHQGAYDKAREGRFVVAGLTSGDMGRDNGHVAVITSGDMVYSSSDQLDYPRGYWGTLGSQGDQCKGMNFSFPSPARKELRYYWKALG